MRQTDKPDNRGGLQEGQRPGNSTDQTEGLRKECARLRAELEAKTIEAAAQREQSAPEILRYINILSHDLRSPLSVSSNFIGLILAKYGLNMEPKMKEYLGYAAEGLRTMDRLLSDAVFYARIGTSQKPLVETDCNKVLESAATALRGEIEASGATVTVQGGEGSLPVVMGDVALLAQLFRNLLANALKYVDRTPEIQISAVAQNGQWLFGFKDNGLGIAPEDRERIFEPLERAHRQVADKGGKGTGLGLAICKKIVERHGGRIWIESVLGEGSIIYFTLPKA
ncbi:MAG: ATP-binding protein [Actinomycetota bacterium]|nr:ATP-binding protein [Actinomycetota bacterium]